MDKQEEKNVKNSQASSRGTDGNKNNPVEVPDSSPVRVSNFPIFNRSVDASAPGALNGENPTWQQFQLVSGGGLRPKPAGNGGGSSSNNNKRHDRQTGTKASVNPPPVANSYPSKYIENIADFLDPAEVRHFLFQGHENEHIAVNYLNPNFGVGGSNSNTVTPQANDNHNSFGRQPPPAAAAPAPIQTVLDTKVCCLFCHRNLIFDTETFQKRLCGHYFHLHCYHAQPPTIQEIHIKNRECNFCVLERP